MNRDLRLAVRIGVVFAAVLLVCYLWLPLPTVVAQTSVTGGGGGVATSVSAAAFPLLAPNGTAAAPPYSFTNATGAGIFLGSSASGGHVTIATNGVETANFNGSQAGLVVINGNWIGFVAGNDANATFDAGFTRVTGSVVKPIGTGSGTDGWLQAAAGEKFVASTATNATVTPANLTDLTVTVISGRKYAIEFVAQVDNSTDTDGIRFDFDGGTAGTTDFRITCKSFNNNLTTNVSTTTALATDITEASYVGVGTFECAGSFEPSGNGTFIPRFATNTAVSGTLSVFRGSYLWLHDSP